MTALVMILYPGLYSLVLGEGTAHESARVFDILYAFVE